MNTEKNQKIIQENVYSTLNVFLNDRNFFYFKPKSSLNFEKN